jgi:tripartite-type tricarboxylate transporter receptor subunit TctC
MRTVRLLAAALLGLSLGSAPAGAQTWPDKVVRMVVPFTPGGPVDAAARVVSQHLQARLGQSIVIENRAGGGTTIGTKAVMT